KLFRRNTSRETQLLLFGSESRRLPRTRLLKIPHTCNDMSRHQHRVRLSIVIPCSLPSELSFQITHNRMPGLNLRHRYRHSRVKLRSNSKQLCNLFLRHAPSLFCSGREKCSTTDK